MSFKQFFNEKPELQPVTIKKVEVGKNSPCIIYLLTDRIETYDFNGLKELEELYQQDLNKQCTSMVDIKKLINLLFEYYSGEDRKTLLYNSEERIWKIEENEPDLR